jgi:PAS domain S-box-containing protein
MAYVHPDDREGMGAAVQHSLTTFEPYVMEYRVIPPNGQEVAISARGTVLFDRAGRPTRGVGIVTDVTAERRARLLLKESEERSRAIVENSLDVIAVIDPDGTVRMVSPSVYAVAGRRPEDVVGRSVTDFVHAEDLPRVMAAIDSIAGVRGASAEAEFRFRHADGTWRTWRSRGTNATHVHAIGGILVNSRDVSEQVELEKRIRQSEKLEAVGQLAGGIAHDFNNLLTVIVGNAELLRGEALMSAEGHSLISELQSAADRAADLIAQLLAFSRRSTGRRQLVDVHAVVDESMRLLARSLDRRIHLTADMAAAQRWVVGDPSSLQSALLNLGVNARDAMPEGGTLTYRTRNVTLGNGDAPVKTGQVQPGSFLEVSVTDSGTGIPEELRHRVFEPFFTTKPVGKGTGLGLAAVAGTVTSLGGAVAFDSAPGRGTTFTLLLPVETAVPAEAGVSAADVTAPGSGRALVVDDEAGVRGYMTRVLGGAGYEVAAVDDGVAALAYLERHVTQLDLVVLDLNMPGRSGADVLRAIRGATTSLPVVVCSGFDPTGQVQELIDRPRTTFLAKPFVPDDLLAAIQRARRA